MRSPLTRRTKRIGAAGAFAAAPAVALAVALASGCDCPLHSGAGPAHAAHHAPAGHAAAMAMGTGAATHRATHGTQSAGAGWEVGTTSSPLALRGVRGPLSMQPQHAGMDHGTPEERYVAGRLEARRLASVTDPQQRLRLRLGLPAVAPADDAVAERAAVLTTAQATKKLSAKCRKLLKVKRPSKLSKADRKRRTACLAQRKRLIAESKRKPTSTPTPTPAPGAAPTATPAPAAGPTPAPTSAPTPTPTPAAGACANKNPCYAAVGVQAIDSDVAFGLSRSTVQADIVNFQLENKDRQTHNLYIAPANASGDIVGPIEKIVGDLAAGGVSEGVNVTLAPGRYKLICIVSGHGPMTVSFTVTAPVR
jgi:hypothetical protein